MSSSAPRHFAPLGILVQLDLRVEDMNCPARGLLTDFDSRAGPVQLRHVQQRLDRLARYVHRILALQPLRVSLRLHLILGRS